MNINLTEREIETIREALAIMHRVLFVERTEQNQESYNCKYCYDTQNYVKTSEPIDHPIQK
jgi:hypothetical protein